MTELLTDQLQRPLHDLRISLTDRCQFRCHYCLPAEHLDVMRQQSQASNHLSFDEIVQAALAFSQLGVQKVRLTGGEPLLRKNLPELIRRLKNISAIKDLAMTTNGALLEPVLPELIEAGLDRITISLDAVVDQLFKNITGTGQAVAPIIEQIFRCAESSLKAVKVNCVIQKNINEHQIIPMLELFRGTGVEVRFIEFMDVGNINGWQPSKVLAAEEILQHISESWDFSPITDQPHKPVANRFEFADGQGTFGTIASITQPFCQDCNRARLSADGKVYTCLFGEQGHDIRHLLNKPEQLTHHIAQIWQQRKDQYSLQRNKQQHNHKRIEMFVLGG